MSLSEKCNVNKKKLLQIKMDFLRDKAQNLIDLTTAAAGQVVREGGTAATEGLEAVETQIEAVKAAIDEADTCTWVTGVVRFVDGIAVAIILVTILQTLRSKHRLIPGVVKDAFNKLGNLIGVPKHSADVMRHLTQLGMMFLGVIVLRMIAYKITADCGKKLVTQTMVLQKMVKANEKLTESVLRVVKAVQTARVQKTAGNEAP